MNLWQSRPRAFSCGYKCQRHVTTMAVSPTPASFVTEMPVSRHIYGGVTNTSLLCYRNASVTSQLRRCYQYQPPLLQKCQCHVTTMAVSPIPASFVTEMPASRHNWDGVTNTSLLCYRNASVTSQLRRCHQYQPHLSQKCQCYVTTMAVSPIPASVVTETPASGHN